MKVEAGNSAAYVCVCVSDISVYLLHCVQYSVIYSSIYGVSTYIQYIKYYIHSLQTNPGVLITQFIGLCLWFSFTIWMVVPRRVDPRKHLI